MEVLNQYIDELKEDCIVNELNLKDTALRTPAIKAKWVSRLIMHKRNVIKLNKEKEKILNFVVNNIKNSKSPVTAPIALIQKQASNSDDVRTIDSKIKDEQLLVDLLEKYEKIISSMTFDIKNITEILKLEMT